MNATTGRTRVVGMMLVVVGVAAACNRGPTPEQVAQQQTQRAKDVASGPCAADGLWKECSLTDRLLRAGMGVRLDSAPAKDSAIAKPGLLYHIGRSTLQAYFFADSVERKAAVAKLDTTGFIGYEATQVYPPKTSMLQSGNLLALLVSQSETQRQRIGDAITAGAPQAVKR